MALKMHPTSYGNPVIRGDMNTIHVGKYCSIADTAIFDGGFQHNPRAISTFPFHKLGVPEDTRRKCRGNITIGNDVWIGEGAIIMSGVSIGNCSIIGAGTIVTTSLMGYSVYCGSPARHKRDRWDPIYHNPSEMFICHAMDKIAWWDWPEDKIKENAHLLQSEDIIEFISIHLPKVRL